METLTPLARSRSSLSAASIYRRRPIMILEFGRTMVGLEAQNTTVVASLSPTYLATSHGQFHPNTTYGPSKLIEMKLFSVEYKPSQIALQNQNL
jgi:hypothetical protein